MTKAEEIYNKVEEMTAGGRKTRPDAFREIARELGLEFNSVRGAYYSHKRVLDGGGTSSSRPRRRETTPEDAVNDAKASLQRAIDSIDREVTAADERAREAKAEYEALRKSAPERKQAIQIKLEALG